MIQENDENGFALTQKVLQKNKYEGVDPTQYRINHGSIKVMNHREEEEETYKHIAIAMNAIQDLSEQQKAIIVNDRDRIQYTANKVEQVVIV